jgi:hypothetical protein
MTCPVCLCGKNLRIVRVNRYLESCGFYHTDGGIVEISAEMQADNGEVPQKLELE